MRELFQKLGKVYSVLFITVFSVFLSDLIAYFLIEISHSEEFLLQAMVMATIIPLIVAPISGWPVMGLLQKVDSLEKEMRELATFDSLTGLLNRRAFFNSAKKFISFAEREHLNISVVEIDLDNFKKINDTFGHFSGDEVLKHFATTTVGILRKGDIFGRVGGEEFVILLPNTLEKEACILVERLHAAVRQSHIKYEKLTIKYTMSIGLISLMPNKEDDIENILKKADHSLYRAKENGRNRTEIFNNKHE